MRTLLAVVDADVVDADQSGAVQSAAVVALGRLDDPSVAPELLRRWPRLLPVMRRQVLPVLLARPDRAHGAGEGGGVGNRVAERAHADADRVSDGPPDRRRARGRGLRLQATGRRGSPGCPAALPGRRRSPRQQRQGADDVSGAVCVVPRSGPRRQHDWTGHRDRQELHAGRGPHASARSQPHGRCAVSARTSSRRRTGEA